MKFYHRPGEGLSSAHDLQVHCKSREFHPRGETKLAEKRLKFSLLKLSSELALLEEVTGGTVVLLLPSQARRKGRIGSNLNTCTSN